MRRRGRWLTLSWLLLLASASVSVAQQPSNPAAAPAGPPPPEVGTAAPDFTFHGVTRYGILSGTQRLSDYRGQTVVLWLFIKARTRG